MNRNRSNPKKQVLMFKKISYYKDVGLLTKIIFTYFKVSLFCWLGKISVFLEQISFRKVGRRKCHDREKITRYVNFWLLLCRKLGVKNTCFPYSLLLCSVLHQSGVKARINFGVKNNNEGLGDKMLIGHCWVTVPDEKSPEEFSLLFHKP